ncbi:uromodulin-like 1 [Choloepus didactylus]|uniref:uromodulin-like 1 n=1 Tax=Choloepus didactylus TaxID=27675 RepID=UPI00189E3D61|nr:uromodulin-like 1 [Choloepus didactylus]
MDTSVAWAVSPSRLKDAFLNLMDHFDLMLSSLASSERSACRGSETPFLRSCGSGPAVHSTGETKTAAMEPGAPRHPGRTVLRPLGLALLALLSAVDPSQASGFTEDGLSLLSYQLCSYRVTRNVQRVVAVQAPQATDAPCGGWIPWRRCPKTVSRTQYRAVEVPETRNVTRCCGGFEQLGLYCVLPLNQSGEFASRPGVCPKDGLEVSTELCTTDADCPGLQKCCPAPGGPRCVAPEPQAPEKNLTNFWYNVTVLVKMGFQELSQVDPGLLNHMRLLGSLVMSALQPLDSAVHHLHSASEDTSIMVSQLLLGLPQPLPVANVSAMLDDIVTRTYEVINIQVQDVNECLHDELNACSGRELCLNVEGSYQCVCHPDSTPSPPPHPNGTCEDCPPIRNYMFSSVTSSSFRVSWSLNSTQNHTFHVQVYKGDELLRSTSTTGRAVVVTGLEAAVLYGVKTSYQACGANITAALTIKTDARVFEVTIRITNRNVTEELLIRRSMEFQGFSRQLLHEVEKSFPPPVSDLHRRGKLQMQIVSLQAGSVVVRLRIAIQDPEFPVDVSTLAPMLPRLLASAVFQIDQQGTLVRDWDECADSQENDCSPAARCVNLEGSYTCECRTARDANPSRAGRACEGEMVSPMGGTLSPTTGVMAPALGSGATPYDTAETAGSSTPGPENSAMSHSPRHLRSTPEAGQAQTLGPPPRRQGDRDVVGYDRNSTGVGVEEEVSSLAPGLVTGQRRTGGLASTVSPSRSPGPTHGPLLGAADGLLDPFGQLLQNATTELPSRPTPTEIPTGHVLWHPSVPTQGAPPAPLNATLPWNMGPGPSSFPGLTSAPSPASLRTPACAPVPIQRIRVSNVTSTGFHVAWAADLSLHPTFQLTLISTGNLIQGLETQNTSLALSGLEPGVLHVVEIVAKACGEESATVRLKVRTAAQKLSGKVRIANVRYSESFRNASSKEYQDFLELFFRMVRKSLPAAMLHHLDTGGIRLEISSITEGSVVVAFHLLIVADVDAREVSAVFLTAFQNTSLLEVIRDDTFIEDYDECEHNEDDCAAGASCHNTLGSFTCICPGGVPDPGVENPGRGCEGDSPSHATWTPGSPVTPDPEGPPTPAGMGATPAPGASAAPQGLPRRLSLTGAVSVLCEMEKVTIAVQKRFLQQESIPEPTLYLGEPACNVSSANDTHVLLAAGWSECGTIVQSNMTVTVVTTTLRNDLSPEGVIHYLKILSPIHCAFRNDLLTSSGYTPEWGVYTIIEDLHGAGIFLTEMQLFIGESPIPQNYSVSASDDVKIEVGLYRQKSNLRVVLTECWATPSSDATDPVMFGFINNSCPIPNTHTKVIENGNSNKAQFKLKIFSFVNNSIVYLHCKLRICLESPEATCKINCNDFRSLRSNEASGTHQTSWGPLIRSEGDPPGAGPSLGVGYSILIGAAVFAVLVGVAGLLTVHSQRVSGRNSFTGQPDDFTYRAFRQ